MVTKDDCHDMLRGQNSCNLDDGSLCYRHRFLLRKLLLNKCWSLISCRFTAWREFCSRSSTILHRLLTVDQHYRRRCAFSRWKRIVYCQQLNEQAEATVIVRRSRQARKTLSRVVAKHDKLLLTSVWVEWCIWHRKQRCILFQRGTHFQTRRRFQQWSTFVRQAKTQRQDREQFIRHILHDVVSSALLKPKVPKAALIIAEENQGVVASHVLQKCFNALERFQQRQELVRKWIHWMQFCRQSSQQKTLQTSVDKRLKNRPEQHRHKPRIRRRSKNVTSARTTTRKMPWPAWQ